MNTGANKVRSSWEEEAEDSFQKFRANQFFEFCLLILEAFHDSGYTQRALLHNLLVAVAQDVK